MDVVESKLEVLKQAGILDHIISLEALLDREAKTEQWKTAVCHYSYTFQFNFMICL